MLVFLLYTLLLLIPLVVDRKQSNNPFWIARRYYNRTNNSPLSTYFESLFLFTLVIKVLNAVNIGFFSSDFAFVRITRHVGV